MYYQPRSEEKNVVSAAKRRKNAAHGVSRGCKSRKGLALEGRKKIQHPMTRTKADLEIQFAGQTAQYKQIPFES